MSVTYISRPLIGRKYCGGGYWGGWACRGPQICCSMKQRKGCAELCHTQTLSLASLWKFNFWFDWVMPHSDSPPPPNFFLPPIKKFAFLLHGAGHIPLYGIFFLTLLKSSFCLCMNLWILQGAIAGAYQMLNNIASLTQISEINSLQNFPIFWCVGSLLYDKNRPCWSLSPLGLVMFLRISESACFIWINNVWRVQFVIHEAELFTVYSRIYPILSLS